MSLEATIAENTVAIRDLIALLSAGVVIDKAKSNKKPAPKAENTPAPEPVTAEVKPEEPEIEQVELVTSKPTYEHVSKAIVSLHRAKGREAALAVLQKFGLENAREAVEDQWLAIIDEATKALEA